jgi:hypothetical protein
MGCRHAILCELTLCISSRNTAWHMASLRRTPLTMNSVTALMIPRNTHTTLRVAGREVLTMNSVTALMMLCNAVGQMAVLAPSLLFGDQSGTLRAVRVFHHGFCRVRVSLTCDGGCQGHGARFQAILHSRMLLDPTHVRLTLLHACDQWHSSRDSLFFQLLPFIMPKR